MSLSIYTFLYTDNFFTYEIRGKSISWWIDMIATKKNTNKHTLSHSDRKFNFEVTSVFPVNRHAIFFSCTFGT